MRRAATLAVPFLTLGLGFCAGRFVVERSHEASGSARSIQGTVIPGDESDAEVTLRYWNALHDPSVAKDGFREFSRAGGELDTLDAEDVSGFAGLCASECEAEASRIARLPLKLVHPAAVEWGVALVEFHQESARVLRASSSLVSEIDRDVSLARFLFDFATAVSRSEDTGQQAMLSGLGAGAATTVTRAGELAGRAQDMREQLGRLLDLAGSQPVRIAKARNALTTRFRIEFAVPERRETPPVPGDADLKLDVLADRLEGKSVAHSTIDLSDKSDFRLRSCTWEPIQSPVAVRLVLEVDERVFLVGFMSQRIEARYVKLGPSWCISSLRKLD